MKVTRLFEFLVGCQHSSLSRVFTIGRRTYCVCYECGAEFDYVPGRKRGSLPVLDCQRAFAEVRVLVLPRSSAACVLRACHRLAPAVARHASLQLEGEAVCSTQDFACAMTARPHANFPQFWSQTTMAMLRNQFNSPVEQMGLGPSYQTLAELSGGSGTGGLSGMPTLCLPVVCSLPARGCSQLFVFSMRCGLTTPPFMQVLAIKRRSSCDIGARYCETLCTARMTQFLYMLSCSFRLGLAAVGRNCARASCTSWCGDTRELCVQKWFGLGDECTRPSLERRGYVLGCSTSIGGHSRCQLLLLAALAVAEP